MAVLSIPFSLVLAVLLCFGIGSISLRSKFVQGIDPVSQLAVVVATSVGGSGLLAFCLYMTAIPKSGLAIVALNLLVAAIHRDRLRSLLNIEETRHTLRVVGVVGTLFGGLTALERVPGGPGWSGDWREHWERAALFSKHLPVKTVLFGDYVLPARPPLANTFTAAIMDVCGTSYLVYQIVGFVLSLTAVVAILSLRRAWQKTFVPLSYVEVLVLIACPSLYVHLSYAWTKAVSATLLLVPLSLVLISRRQQRRPPIGLTGCLLACSVLIHYSAVPFVIAIVLWESLSAHIKFATKQPKKIGMKQTVGWIIGVGGVGTILLVPWILFVTRNFGISSLLDSTSSVQQRPAGGIAQMGFAAIENLIASMFPFGIRRLLHPTGTGGLFAVTYLLRACVLLLASGLGVGFVAMKHARQMSKGRSVLPAMYSGLAVGLLAAFTAPEPGSLGQAHVVFVPFSFMVLAYVLSITPQLSSWTRRVLVASGLVDLVLTLGQVAVFNTRTLKRNETGLRSQFIGLQGRLLGQYEHVPIFIAGLFFGLGLFLSLRNLTARSATRRSGPKEPAKFGLT